MRMRVVMICVILLFISVISKGQDTRVFLLEQSMKPKLGLRTGASLSKLDNGYEETGYQFGFSFGGALKIPVNRIISLQNEMVFSKKGGSITYLKNAFYTGDVRYRLYYLDFPLLLRIKLGRAISLVGGYQGSLLIDANVEYVDPYVYGFVELDEREMNSWDNALVAGLAIGGRNRAFDIRVNYGLTDVAKSDYANTFLGDARNVSVMFCFTRYFGRR
ncbi:PorT family protein [Puteibacter caeruleilacunae]|nr:PorT family protein [Puteibacter caeruleilacunae]